jgi:hypothetical protein
VKWQTCAASAFWACSDQFVKGVVKASRYYPRVITTALWLTESMPRKDYKDRRDRKEEKDEELQI